MSNENILDELYNLQQKRSADIADQGQLWSYEGSATTFKAVDNADGTMWAASSAHFHKHQVIRSGSKSLFITSAEKQAGRILVKYAAITGHLQRYELIDQGSYQKPVKVLRAKSSPIPYASGFKVQPGTVQIHEVVEIGCRRYEVVDKYLDYDSGLEVLQLQSYSEPNEQQLKYALNTGSLQNRQPQMFRVG